MSTSIVVRDIDPGDKSCLRRKARQIGISMEQLGRRLVHEQRTKTELRPKPYEPFARHFGVDHGFGLPPSVRCGYRPLPLSCEGEERLFRSPGSWTRTWFPR